MAATKCPDPEGRSPGFQDAQPLDRARQSGCRALHGVVGPARGGRPTPERTVRAPQGPTLGAAPVADSAGDAPPTP